DRIQHLARDGAALRLELDPAYSAYNRLSLVHLTSDRLIDHAGPLAQRRRIRRLAWTLLPLAALLGAPAGRAGIPGGCTAGPAATGAFAAAAVVTAGYALARRVALGGEDHFDVREALIAELFVRGVPARLAPSGSLTPMPAMVASEPLPDGELWHGLRS